MTIAQRKRDNVIVNEKTTVTVGIIVVFIRVLMNHGVIYRIECYQ